jgi:RimJ/RimL family protein N-acetyltransferase
VIEVHIKRAAMQSNTYMVPCNASAIHFTVCLRRQVIPSLAPPFGIRKHPKPASAAEAVYFIVKVAQLITYPVKLHRTFAIEYHNTSPTMEQITAATDASITINTDRLLLREFTVKDVDGYYELESSEENARYQDWPPRTREQARDLVLSNIQSSGVFPRAVWELVVEHEGRLIGRVGARLTFPKLNTDAIAQAQDLPHFDLWFSFLPAVQGRGFAAEAMRSFIAEMVKCQGGKKVELEIECDPRNTGSWKLAERLDFEKYSLTERAWECKGQWVGSLVYRKVI